MGAMSAETASAVPDRLVRATVKLLAEKGPSAIKARTVAAEAGLSTMVVYSHFGGIPELIRAAVDAGFSDLDKAFSELPVTEDPIADLFGMALATRRVARANPHLYDLMFGLSTRATYRPLSDRDLRLSGHSVAFQSAYLHITDACSRLTLSGRVGPLEAQVVAAGLWSFVHGYISLELGHHFADFDDPVMQIMLPMGVTFAVGLGDEPERARASHMSALRFHQGDLNASAPDDASARRPVAGTPPPGE